MITQSPQCCGDRASRFLSPQEIGIQSRDPNNVHEWEQDYLNRKRVQRNRDAYPEGNPHAHQVRDSLNWVGIP